MRQAKYFGGVNSDLSYVNIPPFTIRTIVFSALFICSCLASPAAVSAQDRFPRDLQAKPYDRNSHAVKKFLEERSETESAALSQARSLGLPNDQMFATIVPDRGFGESGPPAGVSQSLIDEAQKACPTELVEWDPSERRGWFQINFGAPCRLTLYCNWLVDPLIDEEAELLAREQEFRSIESGGEVELPPGGEIPADALDESDAHVHGYKEVSLRYMLADTRSCNLTRECTSYNDKLCNKDYLRLKAAQINIQQLGK